MKNEKQPQILRLRPLRRTSLRMTDQLFEIPIPLFSAIQFKGILSC
jgi:hypothetical protein